MACSILTEERWSQLLEGRLSKEEKALILDHLEIDCPDCEYIFERMSDDEELRFREIYNQKAANKAARPRLETIADDSGRTSNDKSESRRPAKQGFLSTLFGGRSPAPVWAGGIAAMLLIVVGITTQFQGMNEVRSFPPGESRHLQFDKGLADKSASINLQFAIGHSLEKKDKFKVSRGVLGERVNAADRLFLHYDLSADGYVYIFGYAAGKGATLLSPVDASQSQLIAAGSYDVFDGGKMNGLSLAEIQGRYTVVGVHSSKPIDRLDKVISAIRQAVDSRAGSLDAAIINSIKQDVAVDIVYFDVAT